LADDCDSPKANHDDEGQHDGILNRRWALFPLDKLNHCLTQLAHGETPFFLLTGPTRHVHNRLVLQRLPRTSGASFNIEP
jgi:hypothetical protein